MEHGASRPSLLRCMLPAISRFASGCVGESGIASATSTRLHHLE
jgi:hypothetical protein